MCRRCVKETLPDRGSTCLDGGTYFLNWKACGSCGSRDIPAIDQRTQESSEMQAGGESNAEDDDDEEDLEIVRYVHKCSACGHEICEHYYKYYVEDQTQEYFMECVLCGKGCQTSKTSQVDHVSHSGAQSPGDTQPVDVAGGLLSQIQQHIERDSDDSDGSGW
eukprot:CAMPEP_0203757194 /NCGR_PEP_ID=MMETSP0098-20131031/10330_1 /ASSEMBLY_ACC=CAM_ASM_000208 /TAXON_ID=96639 /ORGANISM=" , Strain NY0313808BC1" /LENGTH=162 /DNA_ID=CAMNT_0050649341 /DNA_START=105 /DNA_END=590 /DNA_ORIENTATION=+